MNTREHSTHTNADEKKPLTITELAKLHLNDPTHTTTDEELRNATLELTGEVEVDDQNLMTVDNETVIPPMDFEKEDEPAKSEDDTSSSSSRSSGFPNPYDVLS